jgi:hypothetical protein
MGQFGRGIPMIKQSGSYVEILPETVTDEDLLGAIRRNRAVFEALRKLREANDSAEACDRDPWDFSVELSQFSDSGIGTHILRMMICRKWITHMREVSSQSKFGREFEPESDLVLSRRSCFLLTKKGFEIANKLDQLETISMNQHHRATDQVRLRDIQLKQSRSIDESRSPIHPMPRWDRKRRELTIGNILVKRFKWPAENQEQVLDAFEEEGWPPRIDDPLIPHPKIDPKRRLHDTLKCLNRKQINACIKFRGDGTGQGVLLEINWHHP